MAVLLWWHVENYYLPVNQTVKDGPQPECHCVAKLYVYLILYAYMYWLCLGRLETVVGNTGINGFP